MATSTWQPPKPDPAKSKAELREILAEAVRNTQPEHRSEPEPKPEPKLKTKPEPKPKPKPKTNPKLQRPPKSKSGRR